MKTRYFLLLAMTGVVGCGKNSAVTDPQVGSRGSGEVAAQRVACPVGAIFHRNLYAYATWLQCEVVGVTLGVDRRSAGISGGL